MSVPVSAFVALTETVSRNPSPFGENHWVVSAPGDRPSSAGARVSTRTVRVALAGALSQLSTPLMLTV